LPFAIEAANFGGLIGAIQSNERSYLEYFDGSFMTDGSFFDVSGTPFGSVYGGGYPSVCFMISETGNVVACTKANVLCEKNLVKDLRMCLNKTSQGGGVTINATFSVTFPQKFSARICIEYCRGIADFQVTIKQWINLKCYEKF
jgi:hypothetical protein